MKFFQNTFSIVLSFIILAGTSGISVEKFYCGSFLRSTHIFTSPIPCCAETNTPEGKCRTEKEYFKADLQGNLPINSQTIEKQNISSINIITNAVQLLFFNSKSFSVEYVNFKPPLLTKDISIIFQSIII